MEYWDDGDSEIECDFPDLPIEERICSSQSEQLNPEQHAIVWWVVLFSALFQTMHSLPIRAVQWLLKFLSCLLTVLGNFSPQVRLIADAFPGTVAQRSQYFKNILPATTITNMVVCPACHSIFPFNGCFEKRGSQLLPRHCSNCLKSNERVLLLKEVVTNQGSRKLYPFCVYPTCSLIDGIKSILTRPGALEMCEEWRKYFELDPARLKDSFDGRIWTEFFSSEGESFLASRGSIGLILNIDWFQPFKHRQYSIGVLYMAIMNLPRSIRFKRENLLLIGLIPGPSEPPKTINTYLAPVVDDLLLLWQGVPIQCGQSDIQSIRCALLCVACDLPAARKTCGFLSYTANLGCSRCYCNFGTGVFGVKNYAGFNRQNWKPRSNNAHRRDVESTLKCSSKTQRNKKESELGCRYSVLLKLPYFDPVKMAIIDPMHNLYLGTAKYIFLKIWMVNSLQDRNVVAEVERRVTSITVPASVRFSRIPSPTNNSLTAEQWMIWVNYYSIFCMHDILTKEEMDCWRTFVLASRLLSLPSLSKEDISLADKLLLTFCQRFERLHGPSSVTPNMHMHGHLIECVKDFGPLSSFWLFSFERFNGLLGDLPTNNCLIEMQVMKRFVSDSFYLQLLSCNPTDSSEANDLFKKVIIDHTLSFQSMKYQSSSTSKSTNTCTSGFKYVPGSKHTLAFFNSVESEALSQVYCHLYASLSLADVEDIPQTYKKMLSVSINGQLINAGQYVFAKTVFDFESTPQEAQTVFTNTHNRPAKIDHFALHRFSVNDSVYVHCFAIASWPMHHPDINYFGKPYQLWCRSLYESSLKNFAIPIEYIGSVLLTAEYVHKEETVLLVVPVVS